MNKQKFKVGDRVRIVEAYPEYHNGEIAEVVNPHYGLTNNRIRVKLRSGDFWNCVEVELVKPKHPVIVITSDGKTTTATIREGKKVLKATTAKCSGKDTFSFDEGARIAFERLQGREPFYEEKRHKRPEKLVCVSKPRTNAFMVGKVYNPIWLSDDSFGVGLFTGRRIGDKFIVPVSIGDAEFIPLVED